ncbi:hypothetical protein CMK10_10745, partial [Candidatus Poribacteria bacterium]|nr:hypothetical protein [Candidatus Poribacteria bacterium]
EIPVIVECYLGAASEEVEPFNYLSFPQVTFRQLKAIYNIDSICGIKEYFGTIPNKEDANLRVAGLFFKNPAITEHQAIDKLAVSYGQAAEKIKKFWAKTSEAMELFPWDTSWFIREVGRCDIHHGMSGAFIRGQQAHSPSWCSTRAAIFMKTDSRQPDPWMLEDVQLRCTLAEARMAEAIEIGNHIKEIVPEKLREDFEKQLAEWVQFRKVAVSYKCHLRETNLAELMRKWKKKTGSVPPEFITEMRQLLVLDNQNQTQSEEILAAIKCLDTDVEKFISTYFVIEGEDEISKGHFSLTTK